MIDTHVHFWEYDEIRDAWIDDTMKKIQRDFLPQDIDPLLKENAVDAVIAVQADQSDAETEFLIKLAESYPKIAGVIGWIDLLGKDLAAQLEKYQGQKILKGWRHIVQAEPKGFLSNPQFIKNVQTLGKAGYTYGILIYHHQFEEALDFVSKVPDQPLILNHLGKPDLKNLEQKTWGEHLKKLAEYPNVYCKLSGLVTEADPGAWTKEILYTYLDIAVEHFGTERLVIGSDWPVMLLNSNYSEWIGLLKKYVQQFSADEQEAILHNNAVNFYNLSL